MIRFSIEFTKTLIMLLFIIVYYIPIVFITLIALLMCLFKPGYDFTSNKFVVKFIQPLHWIQNKLNKK